MAKYSDEQIIQGLLAKGISFEEMSMHVFHQYKGYIPKVAAKINLDRESAYDAYSDAIVKLIRQVRSGKFEGKSKLSSYFYRIFYNTSVDVLRKNTTKKNISFVELHEYDARERDLLNVLSIKDEAGFILKQIEQLGVACKKILMDWAYYGYSMEEIAQRNGLSNSESARSRKYKCLKKLKEEMKKYQ